MTAPADREPGPPSGTVSGLPPSKRLTAVAGGSHAGDGPFIVLGTHRSGTSLVARVLEELGVSMSPTVRGPGWRSSWANPTGYLEDIDFVNLDNRMLGIEPERDESLPDRTSVTEHPGTYDEDVRRLLSSRSGIWGWKNPWTVLTLEAYLPFIQSPRIIVCKRDRSSVEASMARHGLAYRAAKELYPLFEARLDPDGPLLRGLPVLWVRYEEITSHPREVIGRIVAWSGLHPTAGAIESACSLVLAGESLVRARRRASLRSMWMLITGSWIRYVVGREARSSLGFDRSIRRLLVNAFRAARALVAPDPVA